MGNPTPNLLPRGNAAAVYTSVGAHADWFTSRFAAGMLGVNVGVPVPREPFSFGGLCGTNSCFGDMDITGTGGMEFFTNRRKVTTRWGAPLASAAVTSNSHPLGDALGQEQDPADKANFAGTM